MEQYNLNSTSISKRKPLIIIAGIILLVLLSLLIINLTKAKADTAGGMLPSTIEKEEPPVAKATTSLNHQFEIPIKNEKGQEVAKIKYIIESAELKDEILVKGQKATAVKGKTFLILNLKLINDSENTIQINTRDFIRLVVNNNEQELLAPDIHNDPVEVQAISTKYSQIGFPINDTDQSLKLKVGEIGKDRTNLDLNF